MRSSILSSVAMAMLGVGLAMPQPTSYIVGGAKPNRDASLPGRSGGKRSPAGSKLARRAAAGTVGLARLR